MIWLETNNPFNIRYNKDNDWQGAVGLCHDFVKFETIEFGIRAGLVLLKNYIKRGLTIRQIVERYAPPSENDTASYISFVCLNLSCKESFRPNNKDLASLARTICRRESGAILPLCLFNSLIIKFHIY